MDTSIFEELGLTRTEIKVYLSLLELGSSSAGRILERSGLPNSTVHRDLNSLIEKGLINFILEGKKKIYQATRPENFFDFIEEKKKRFEEIYPELKMMQERERETENASIFKGRRGIQRVYDIMINSKGEEYLTFGGGPSCVETMGVTWWLNLHNRRIANKLSSRQVFDLVVKEMGGKEIQKKKLTNIRYLSKEFAQFQETVIVGDKVAISVFGDNPYSFLINDPKVAEGYKKYFEKLWNLAI